MYASDLMVNDFAIASPTDTVAAAARLMLERDTGCIVVVDGGRLAGIITERDMALGCLIDGHSSLECEVRRHMTPLTDAAAPTADIGDALLAMMDKGVTRLPVATETPDGGDAVLGVLFAEDLTHAIEQDDKPLDILDDELILV